jgi:hypothetical protein
MKIHLFIQICVFSSKKEGYHLEIGSNVAISSTEKVRIYRQRFPLKKISPLWRIIAQKKSLGHTLARVDLKVGREHFTRPH